MLLSASSVRECVMQSSAGQIRNELFFLKKGHSVISICKYLFNIIIYFTVNSVNVAPLHIAADDSVGRI